MKKVKNILLLLTAIFTLGCSQTIVFEDVQTPTPTPTPKPEPEPEPDDKQLTSAPYAVGDYYYDGTMEGVVFEVSADGTSGKIVSMMQSTDTLQWSSDETEQKRLIGAGSEADGAANMAVVKAISGWESKYPAFKWCADLGEGWYMPAIEELKVFTLNDAVHDAVNNTLSARGGTKLYDIGESKCYWSSTENDYQLSNGEFCVWRVDLYSGGTNGNFKNRNNYVRAVATFGDAQQSDPTPGITSAPYAVGDYYNDGTKEGVVFEVSADGTSGKIVSMMQSTGTLQWSSDTTEQKRLIGADSETDGAYNTAKVKAISGWETKYPAFKWCADLGDEWYLPSEKELVTISKNQDKIDSNLTDKLSSFYWSSTEYNSQNSDGYIYAIYVDMSNGLALGFCKYDDYSVRAVTTFGDAQQSEPTPEPTEPANNEIWYTSTDGAVIAHHSGSVSGANIVSNTYTNGKGVLTFDGNVTKILSYLFSAQSKLKSIVLPNSVTHIYTQAFGNCYNLVDVDLGSGLTYIGNAAFDACSALTSITIPDSVTFIGPAPFLACYNLANFYGAAATDDHKGLVIDNTFVSFAPAGPTEYSIPHGVTVIQDGSFNDCQKITKVTIPATVVEIEEQAFYRCYALSVVNCLPTTPPTLLMHSSYGTFDSNASDRKIYVPASSVSAYKSASGWSTYADAIVADPASEPTPEITSAPYAVGDYYNDGTKEGVVFEVSADGTSGKIVSMMQSTGTLQWSSDRTEQERLIGADSETDGAYNTAKVKAISGWETKYPAFKWCADLGEGWYMPAIEELKVFTLNDAVHDAVNNTLSARDGTKLYDIGESKWYWSSTESDEQYDGYFCAWGVNMYDGYAYNLSKRSISYVRAVSAF